MNNISLKSIKYESIKAIFTSIAGTDKISRAEISEKTSLSLVTVGKIADALLDMNIVCQVKEIRPQAGRRAGLLSVNENKFSLILDLTSYDFRIAILDLRMHLVEKSGFTYRSGSSYADNLHAFLNEAYAMINRRFDPADCFGVGVTVPGPYNEQSDTAASCRVPELQKIRLKETMTKYFRNVPILIDSQINAAAKSNIRHIEGYKEKNILYWFVGQHYICGAYLVDGNLILGKDGHASDFGRMLYSYDLTLEQKVGLCRNQTECAEVLSGSIYNILHILNPHTLIMEYDMPFPCDDMLDMIREILITKYHYHKEDLPDMERACCKFRNSHRGLTMGLRELWLDKIVFGQNGSEN